MDVLPNGSTVRLKTLVMLSRWAVRLVLGAWLLLFMMWAGLHLLIVPRIDEYRPQIETWISRSLGVPLRIGAVTAESVGLLPSIEFSGVRLLDSQGREALRLPRIQTTVTPQSLWNFGFAQLYIEGLQLQVRRAADGRIFVAGIELPEQLDNPGAAADWLFSQSEFVIRDGAIDWTDEMRGAPTLSFSQLNLVMRNGLRRHALRLDATPPSDWGSAFTLIARMRSPLLSLHPGRWQDWDGQLHAVFDRIDLARLRPYADLGPNLQSGEGELRAWADVRRGQLTGGTADLQLSSLDIGVAGASARLSLAHLAGRISARHWGQGYEVWTENLDFKTSDGIRWPGGNLRLLQAEAGIDTPARGELQGEQLELQALARIALQLPLNASLHEQLRTLAPSGRLEQIQAKWQGEPTAPHAYEVKGRVARLGLSARTRQSPGSTLELATPGVRGLGADFEFNQSGGKAALTLAEGFIDLPGWYEEPALAFSELRAEALWRIDGEAVSLQIPKLFFSNADGQGELQLRWQSAGQPAGQSAGRSPGVLELQANMSRAAGHRVYRYLPMEVPRAVRDYLQAAIPNAPATAVRVRLKGDLRHFPFADPRQGEFQISAQLRDASFVYFPASLQATGEPPWPALSNLSAEFQLDRTKLQLKKVTARLADANQVRITRAEASIADYLRDATVSVQAEARGPLGDLLTSMVNGSPLSGLTDHLLDKASGSGSAEVQFGLRVPLATPQRATVQGKVTLAGNDLQVMPQLPRLQRARGVVHFSEKGFALSGAQARALGGELRADGGTIFVPGTPVVRGAQPQLTLNGQVTAEGLRQVRDLGALTRMAQLANGATSFSATIGWAGGATDLLLTSNLQGLSLNLPAPLNKTADAVLPLRLEIRPQTAAGGRPPTRDRLMLALGQRVLAEYVRDLSAPQARVLRGSLGVGLTAEEAPTMPASGVVALARFERLDLDAWRSLLPGSADSGASELMNYLPTSLALRAAELTLDGRSYEQLVAGGTRDGSIWRINLDAREISGYLEYQAADKSAEGRLYARLARLVLAPSATAQVEKLLDVQPDSVPALDVVVGDLELLGKRLGRVEVEAVNRGARNWRLNKLSMSVPEARFTAVGNWAQPVDLGNPRAGVPANRRTLMDFKLEIDDAGALLARLGMKDLVRRGRGKMEGQVVWRGSPLSIDYPTLDGTLLVNVESGQFLKADPGIAKLLGVLSLQALPRRLLLDFRDVFSEGFVFDFVRGDVQIQQGIASTNNLQMKGVNAAVLMEGQVDINKETQNLKVVVVPEINAGTASLITSWINPVAGLTSFLAQLLLRQPLIESATQKFRIDGSWTDPRVVRTDASNGDTRKGNKP
ncbi:MAG: YhdP family protein [Hylemonella sp.]